MMWYFWLALASFVFCVIFYSYYLLKIIRTSKPSDFAHPAGSIEKGVRYALTTAMNPRKKESAYLHLPTYTAGLIYHSGTFLSILCFFFFLTMQMPGEKFGKISGFFLFITSINGFGIFVKRLLKKNLRQLSNTDDYLSNILVSTFQLLTALVFFNMEILPVYFIFTSILLIYLPFGKLKHSIFFFAARYHLGVFFGSRNVWPPLKKRYGKIDSGKN